MASNKQDLKKLRNYTVGIKRMLRNPELNTVAKKSAKHGEFLVDKHVRNSKFFGGPFENKGYSRNPLPAFFFGRVSYNENSGGITIVSHEKDRSNTAKFKENEVSWGGFQGRSTPYVKEGYAGWLKKTRPGKDLANPDLTFTGNMLRNFTSRVKIKRGSARIVWFVRPPYHDRAAYTHKQRNWLGFFQKEVEMMFDQAEKVIFRQFRNTVKGR